jgi:type II secretory pathway predicted ATPase ExeA
MYCTYYKFSEKPFDVTPDPRFLYLTSDHRETLASIVYGIRERRGFITIIGEVGTGKTTLLNAALDRMDEKTQVAFIFNTDVTFVEMLNMALYEWGLTKQKETLSKGNAIQLLNRFAIDQLAKGGNVVLIVDEAQNLDNNVMENLRLLSNLETRRHKLIQIVLSGQPELYLKLSRYELRQLAQRISLKRYVSPLDEKDTYAYIRHRLKVVQNADTSPFTLEAQQVIWKYSKGVPRKINILCDNAFLIGYALEMKKITDAVIWEALQDLTWDCSFDEKGSLDENTSLDISSPKNTAPTSVETKTPRRSIKLTAAIVIIVIVVLSGSLLLNTKDFRFAKLTGFISNVKNTILEDVKRVQAKEPNQVSRPDISELAVMKHKIVGQKIPKKNLETDVQEKNNGISYLTLPNYHLLKEKSPDLIIQEIDTRTVKQERKLNQIDQSEPLDIKEEKQNLSVPEAQGDDKEKSRVSVPIKEDQSIRQVMVKQGDTLGNIIIKTYGAYTDMRLFMVQQQNPDINDPNLILPGQIIKLPTNIK